MPAPCPGLGALLQAALDCPSHPGSPLSEAAFLVQHLSVEERQQLHTGALALWHAQRAQRVYLPLELRQLILSFSLA